MTGVRPGSGTLGPTGASPAGATPTSRWAAPATRRLASASACPEWSDRTATGVLKGGSWWSTTHEPSNQSGRPSSNTRRAVSSARIVSRLGHLYYYRLAKVARQKYILGLL